MSARPPRSREGRQDVVADRLGRRPQVRQRLAKALEPGVDRLAAILDETVRGEDHGAPGCELGRPARVAGAAEAEGWPGRPAHEEGRLARGRDQRRPMAGRLDPPVLEGVGRDHGAAGHPRGRLDPVAD